MNIGILGGGQLGRMIALAGIDLDIHCRVLEPGATCPAAAVAEHIDGEFEDYAVLWRFAAGLDAITLEFENVPVASAEWLAERLPVYPPPAALSIAQDRIREKTFFAQRGIAVPEFRGVESREDLEYAIADLGLPAVLKTTRFGYDGKGQGVISTPAQIDEVWASLGGRSLIYEAFVPFERELSILGCRSRSGEIVFWPPTENHHRDGMLRRSIAPAPGLTAEIETRAQGIARRTLDDLNYVGVLAIELFECGGELIVNEMAPRVHNSGHWTTEASETSQFANHLRAVAGLPLGSTRMRGPCEMWNIIGSIPPIEMLLMIPGLSLHLYGKKPRPGRKLGHLTIAAPDADALAQRSREVARLVGEVRAEDAIAGHRG